MNWITNVRGLTWKLGPEVEVVSSVRLAFPGVDREADDRHLTPNTQDVKTNLLSTLNLGPKVVLYEWMPGSHV